MLCDGKWEESWSHNHNSNVMIRFFSFRPTWNPPSLPVETPVSVTALFLLQGLSPLRCWHPTILIHHAPERRPLKLHPTYLVMFHHLRPVPTRPDFKGWPSQRQEILDRIVRKGGYCFSSSARLFSITFPMKISSICPGKFGINPDMVP